MRQSLLTRLRGHRDPTPEWAIWFRSWSVDGLDVRRTAASGSLRIEEPMLDAFLVQLEDDGLSLAVADGFHLTWDQLYLALEKEAFAGLSEMLQLPATSPAIPLLESRGSLIDDDFSIAVAGWRDPVGRTAHPDARGAVLGTARSEELMTAARWRLVNAVQQFMGRPAADHNEQYHREAWGRIRQIALAAGARMDDFLRRTVILTPEKLRLDLRRGDLHCGEAVVEVIPNFDNVPERWLETFDRAATVRDRYDVVTPEGIVQVLVVPQVRRALEEIKRMPGRRMAGARAQAFVSNPFAALGDEVSEVLDEDQIEEARVSAGLVGDRFLPEVNYDAQGRPDYIGLQVRSSRPSSEDEPEKVPLAGKALDDFLRVSERAVAAHLQLIGWEGYEFEVTGDVPEHLGILRAALRLRDQAPAVVTYEAIHDLSTYSDRIAGVGPEKAVYAPFVAKIRESGGWFPENIVPVLVYRPAGSAQSVQIPTDEESINALKAAARVAAGRGEATVSAPELPVPITLEEAEHIASTFERAFEDARKHMLSPGAAAIASDNDKETSPRKSGPPHHLILRQNIFSVDYDEQRREALTAGAEAPLVPTAIRDGMCLLDHQLVGLGWLQHLYGLRHAFQVRGAILADDMGLGKTFQLLAFMARLLEGHADMAPMLVVAPVSLLENWAEEVDKFFEPGTFPLLLAYGDTLKPLKVERNLIDERLRTEDGLVSFLKPDWVDASRLVLTTYETLRNLEFSFAAQKWSVVVCDEAQRIKNPNAMVTRAVKKLHADFRIACTGTPVENTLSDLWCLFDYVQPGLLGSLREFTERYRRPIEAKTDEEKTRVDELRRLVAPQILRRLKSEVAKDLPRKIVDEASRGLPLSPSQRVLYQQAIAGYRASRERTAGDATFKNQLGLLHYLRLICTDPRPQDQKNFQPIPLGQYRRISPKLDWLLELLKSVRQRGEKVLIFCEFREIQRLLQYYIGVELGYKADIINGETSTSAQAADSRQKRIRKFQQSVGFGALILSPVAIGFGVNIQAANHVVHYTRTWNPAKEDQATDRAYRIGQVNDVHVYYPTVSAPDFITFDVKLDELLEYKRGLAEDMLNGAGEIEFSEFGSVVGDSDAALDHRA